MHDDIQKIRLLLCACFFIGTASAERVFKLSEAFNFPASTSIKKGDIGHFRSDIIRLQSQKTGSHLFTSGLGEDANFRNVLGQKLVPNFSSAYSQKRAPVSEASNSGGLENNAVAAKKN